MRGVSDLIASILDNTAAIGLGLGLYENKPSVTLLGLFTAMIACIVKSEGER